MDEIFRENMKSKPWIYRASFCFIVMPSSVVLVCGLGVFFWSNYVMVYLLEYSLNNNNEIKDTTDMIKSGNFLTEITRETLLLSLWRREQKMFAFKNCFESNKMCSYQNFLHFKQSVIQIYKLRPFLIDPNTFDQSFSALVKIGCARARALRPIKKVALALALISGLENCRTCQHYLMISK